MLTRLVGTSATGPVAAIGVPPMASGARGAEPIVVCVLLAGWRDADQCDRDGRAPHFELNRSGPKQLGSLKIVGAPMVFAWMAAGVLE